VPARRGVVGQGGVDQIDDVVTQVAARVVMV
jgi:hypothetical protein